jgi:hypothetical protein
VDRLLNWVKALWRWLAEPRLAWLTLLILLVAVFFSLRPGASEFLIRSIGLVLQLLGVVIVVVGIDKTWKSFGKPGIVKLFFEWWSRRPGWRRGIAITPGTVNSSFRLGKPRAHSWMPIDPSATIDDQVSALTKNVEGLNERLLRCEDEVEAQFEKVSDALRQEQQVRAAREDALQTRLEATQTGGLHISLMGAIWVFFGSILSTLAPEIAGKQIAQSANLPPGFAAQLPNLQGVQGAGQEKMTIALTILSGLALLVVGQIIIRSFIDPVYELRKLRGEVADALIFYANLYMNPGHEHKSPEIDAAVNALRSLGSRLATRRYAIPFYRLFVFRAVPPSDSIERASRNLTGLSNNIYRGDIAYNEKRRRDIVEALKLRIRD